MYQRIIDKISLTNLMRNSLKGKSRFNYTNNIYALYELTNL